MSADVTPDLEKLFRSLAPPPLVKDLIKVNATMQELMKPVSEAMRPFLAAQGRYAELMGNMMRLQEAFKPVGEVIARNNALIARALGNVQAVGLAAQLRAAPLDEVLYAGVAEHLRRVGGTYERLLKSQIAQVAAIRPPVPPELVWRAIAVPTVTVASYTRSLSWEAIAEIDEPFSLDQLDFERGAGADLDDLLADLDPQFVDMRRGSWQALDSDNPDGIRQAAVSFRELVRQVLASLAPGTTATGDAPGSKTKAAVRRLLGGSRTSADFVVALSDAVYELYNYLSKLTHTNYRHTQAVRAALMCGEGLLLFVLVHQSASQTG